MLRSSKLVSFFLEFCPNLNNLCFHSFVVGFELFLDLKTILKLFFEFFNFHVFVGELIFENIDWSFFIFLFGLI